MKANLLIPWQGLQVFAEGAAAGAGANGADAGSQDTGAAGGQQAGQAPDAGVQITVTAPRREETFEQLIRGEYKDLFDSRVQKILQGRMKGANATVERYNALAPVLDMLGSKYGVKDPSDVQALIRAIEADDSFYEEEAMNRGLTVEQLKQIRAMERENRKLTQQLREQQSRERADQLYNQWLQQEQQTKQVYPGFSLQAELGNPQFQQLLHSGIDVRTAYEVIHKDEIVQGAMQFAAQQAGQKIANSVAAGAARPRENGNAGQGAATTKVDVSKMTKKERAEIIRRVQQGERIVF